MEEPKVNIEGSPNLVRNVASMAVINRDSNARNMALSQREKRRQSNQDIDNLKQEVSEIKTMMSKILSLLEEKK